MNTQSKKAKGRRLQQYVVKKILEKYPHLTERDVRSTSMGVSGEDVLLSEEGKKSFPFNVECKNQEKLQIWQALEQSSGDNRDQELIDLLIFKRNRSEVYCTMKLDDLMRLL